MLPAVAENEVEVAVAGTVTEGPGTGSRALLLDNDTTVPPAGAPWLNVTVHVVAAPEFKLVGLHARDVRTTDPTRLTVAVFDTPASVAVKVAL
jgi:hypothetical protein